MFPDSELPAQWATRLGHDDPVDLAGSIERRLEALADEIGRLIESGPRAEREALHDYAVSLIREQAPAAEGEGGADAETEVEPALVRETSGTNAATLVGYGVLLLPAGGLLVLVLPPIGLMLALLAVAMIAGGVGLALISRMRRFIA